MLHAVEPSQAGHARLGVCSVEGELSRTQREAGRAGTWFPTVPAQVLRRLTVTELCVQKDSAKCQRHGHGSRHLLDVQSVLLLFPATCSFPS